MPSRNTPRADPVRRGITVGLSPFDSKPGSCGRHSSGAVRIVQLLVLGVLVGLVRIRPAPTLRHPYSLERTEGGLHCLVSDLQLKFILLELFVR